MIFFTADHHFYHTNIIAYCKRPFNSVEEMNDELVRRWNSVVDINDTVYYLGDFSLARRAVEVFAPRLNGEKYLIMGNHDQCHPIHKKKAELGLQTYIAAGFKTFELEKMIEISGQNVLLNHMPYREEIAEYQLKNNGNQPTLKYNNLRPKDKGLWLLHGHVHEKWKIRDHMINVGVDVWDFFPVPITEIEKIINFT